MKNQNILTVVALAFIISGICGLIYEVVWAKYLALFIGNTTYAHTVVLATFMGGLAAGAYFWGKRSDITSSRLRLYGFLEVVIGLYCFFYPPFLRLLEKTYIAIVAGVDAPSDGILVLSLKLGVSVVSLFLPTFLMGGTLPVLARFITKKIDETGKEVGILYFLNSFGAVVGSFFAGFFLIEAFGLSNTVYIAAIMNCIIGSGMIVLSFFWKEEEQLPEAAPVETAVEGNVEPAYIFSSQEIRIALLTAALSGFAAMVYELTWIRLLTLILGSSVYSFSLMLMAFISGITIGSYIVSKIVQRLKNLYTFLGICELAVGISMLLVLPLYQRLPYYFWVIGDMVSRTTEGYYFFVIIEYVFCFLLMLLPTVFLGMALPLISRIVATDIRWIGKSVGSVFSINTLGTVFGSLLTGLLFIPWIGVHRSIQLGIAISLLLATIILLTSREKNFKRWILALSGWTLLLGYGIIAPAWSNQALSVGVFRERLHSPVPSSYKEFVETYQNKKIQYYKEGVHATVVVTGEEPDLSLVINGKVDASSRGDLGTQLISSHIAAVLSTKFDSVLVIGLGSGITVGAVTRHPVRHVDVIEISPEVREAEALFHKHDYNVLSDPRVKLTIEDAVTFLKTSKNRYDAIISEPSNPWIAGIGNLFTKEFFELSKQRLSSSGLMVQWIHLYELDNELFGLVLRTFTRVFPYVSIWMTMRNDVILVGSISPVQRDFNEMERIIEQPLVARDLGRVQIHHLLTLLSTQMIAPSMSKTIYPFGASNTEEYPYLEYMAPRAFFMNKIADVCYNFDSRYQSSDTTLYINKYLSSHRCLPEEYRELGFFCSGSHRLEYRLAEHAFEKYLELDPEDIEASLMYASVLEQLGKSEQSRSVLKQVIGRSYPKFNSIISYARMIYQRLEEQSSFLVQTDPSELEKLITEGQAVGKDSTQGFLVLQALLDYHEGHYRKALKGFRAIMSYREEKNLDDPLLNDERMLAYAAMAAVESENDILALIYANQALEINPRNVLAMSVFYKVRQRAVRPVAP
ncbi:MAG: fused MFS/spermidine synthase [Bacteroidota bacterium]